MPLDLLAHIEKMNTIVRKLAENQLEMQQQQSVDKHPCATFGELWLLKLSSLVFFTPVQARIRSDRQAIESRERS